MTHFHAVLLDETGCEFGAGHDCETREDAMAYFRESYPESRVVQLESPADTAAREHKIYQDALRGVDYDDEGRPIYPPDYDEDEDLDEIEEDGDFDEIEEDDDETF